MTKLDIFYAKLNFKLNSEKRMALYRKLTSLLSNNFTLMDALGRIERAESKGGRKPDEPFAIAMRIWQKKLEAGYSFFETTRGWAPTNETLMMTLGDISKLSETLENVVRVGEGTQKIKSSMFSAITYPLFLLALTIGIIIMVGIYLVPPLAAAAGNDIVWRGSAASLVWMSEFSKNYWYLFTGGFLILVLLIRFSFTNLSGGLRYFFDKLPPWNMYKIQVSVSWLMSLAAMVRAGGSLPVAMKMLADNSTKYLRKILLDASKFITNGDNLGVSLQNTKSQFPNDEIIGDLVIYADMNDFDQNMLEIANDYLSDSVRKMESISNIMNSIGILLVSLIIAWVVFGTFQMQDQITAALS